ncbi:MAG: manganese efflux pump [Prevotella sp.]|nr:manganese efflux pump [Prevotella sp.]
MSFFDIVLLSVALAMDCFAVSIVSGVLLKSRVGRRVEIRRVALRLSVLFGVFQALMPLAGWLCTTRLARYVEAYDHWVAFGLLAFLGGRMILASFREEETPSFDPSDWKTGVTLAIATSIDALAVGISFAMTGYGEVRRLFSPLLAIGLGSFLFGLSGHLLGLRFGASISRRFRPELVGGLILIAIGVKILVTHLWGS